MPYKNLLLIDDDEDDHEIFFTAVEEINRGITCIGMTNAAEALQQLEAKLLTPEVIFLDLNMPVMSGQDFLKEIKKRPALNDIPVIIFSTSDHLPTIQHAKELGALHFITKPQTYTELVKVLAPYLSIQIQ